MNRIARRILLVLIGLVLAAAAYGQTPCPTVSNGISILNVTIANPPMPINLAFYDISTGYLMISYANRTAQMLIGVPLALFTTRPPPVPWVELENYPSAVMQERSSCPLLTETGAPLWVQ